MTASVGNKETTELTADFSPHQITVAKASYLKSNGQCNTISEDDRIQQLMQLLGLPRWRVELLLCHPQVVAHSQHCKVSLDD